MDLFFKCIGASPASGHIRYLPPAPPISMLTHPLPARAPRISMLTTDASRRLSSAAAA